MGSTGFMVPPERSPGRWEGGEPGRATGRIGAVRHQMPDAGRADPLLPCPSAPQSCRRPSCRRHSPRFCRASASSRRRSQRPSVTWPVQRPASSDGRETTEPGARRSAPSPVIPPAAGLAAGGSTHRPPRLSTNVPLSPAHT